MTPGQIYRGFPPNHFVSFDGLIDLPRFMALETEILRGLARSEWGIGQLGNGHRHDKPDLFQAYEDLKALPDGHPLREATDDLDYLQKRKFLALKTRCLTLGQSVTLRSAPNFAKSLPDDPHAVAGVTETDSAIFFPELLAFIDALPVFRAVGRVNVFITPAGSPGEIHRDFHKAHPGPPKLPHFVWFQMEKKPFFLFDEASGAKRSIDSHAAWFNSNQHHGSDPVDYYAWSLRVDGQFTPEVAKLIGLAP